MSPTVVILLSDKRSGSTMFQDEICKHPDIQTVDYSPHTYLETHHWLKASVILSRPAKRDKGGPLYKGYGSRDNARAYLVDCIQKNVPEFKIPSNDKELVFKGWEALCAKYAKPIFFEKSPQYLGFPASLDLLFEWAQTNTYTVKFIGLTRNPLSVQYSAWKLFHRNPNDRQFGWMELQQEMLDFETRVGPEQFLHVKYEDIIDQPNATFSQICNFIGVEPKASIGSTVHKKSLTKWKEDPYFTASLDESVKTMARRFGYSDDDLDNPEKPEPPIIWKLRKKLEALYKLGRARLKDRLLKPLIIRLKNPKK